jgi:phosphatidylglycerophosphatase C
VKRLKTNGLKDPVTLDMGTTDNSCQGRGLHRPIVAFDFDGTLTVRDSFTAFLAWRAGPARFVAGMIALAPAGLAYLFHRDRGRLKAATAKTFLRGMSRNEIEASATTFAEEGVRKLLRPDALRTWKRWQSQGARLVVVTASPETLVAPFARRLGAEKLIGTRLAFDADDRFTGQFEGENCRGPEKVRRLHQAFGPDLRLAAAYGDTDGDREMLAIARERGFRIFTGKP